MFAYNIVGDRAPLPDEQLFEYREGLYGFVGLELSEYSCRSHAISASWDTVAMPVAEFRCLARGVDEFLFSCDGIGQI